MLVVEWLWSLPKEGIFNDITPDKHFTVKEAACTLPFKEEESERFFRFLKYLILRNFYLDFHSISFLIKYYYGSQRCYNFYLKRQTHELLN